LRLTYVERLNEVVQKAALKELASIDLHGDLALRLPSALIGNGRTRGIWLRALTQEQVKELGFE